MRESHASEADRAREILMTVAVQQIFPGRGQGSQSGGEVVEEGQTRRRLVPSAELTAKEGDASSFTAERQLGSQKESFNSGQRSGAGLNECRACWRASRSSSLGDEGPAAAAWPATFTEQPRFQTSTSGHADFGS